MIQIYNKDKNITVMIWAYFEDDSQKFDLVFMPGDPDSKPGRGRGERGSLQWSIWKFSKNKY